MRRHPGPCDEPEASSRCWLRLDAAAPGCCCCCCALLRPGPCAAPETSWSFQPSSSPSSAQRIIASSASASHPASCSASRIPAERASLILLCCLLLCSAPSLSPAQPSRQPLQAPPRSCFRPQFYLPITIFIAAAVHHDNPRIDASAPTTCRPSRALAARTRPLPTSPPTNALRSSFSPTATANLAVCPLE